MNCLHTDFSFAFLACRICGATAQEMRDAEQLARARERWIPTTERLPPSVHPVMGFFDGDIEKGFITDDGLWSDYYSHNSLRTRGDDWRLTHWRELPEVP